MYMCSNYYMERDTKLYDADILIIHIHAHVPGMTCCLFEI